MFDINGSVNNIIKSKSRHNNIFRGFNENNFAAYYSLNIHTTLTLNLRMFVAN